MRVCGFLEASVLLEPICLSALADSLYRQVDVV